MADGDGRETAIPGAAPRVRWWLEPDQTPVAIRHCPRCDDRREFYCSEKFRVNGQKQRVDVWLIYKCSECDATWKLTLFTRVKPSQIAHDLYLRFEQNDARTAWEYAFDAALIQRCGAKFQARGEVAVAGPSGAELLERGGVVELEIGSPYPMQQRLVALIARQFACTRKQAEAILEAGAIVGLEPEALPKKLSRNVVCRVDLDAITDLLRAGRETR